MKTKTNAEQTTWTAAWKKGGRGRPPMFQTKKEQVEAIKVIKEHGVTQAALILGVSRPVLQKLVKLHKLTLASGRRPGK